MDSKGEISKKEILIHNMMTTIESLLEDHPLSYVQRLPVMTELSRTINSTSLETSTKLFSELLKKYIHALINKKIVSIRFGELVLPVFFNRPDFEDHLSANHAFTSIRVLYKHSDSHPSIRKLLLQCEPVLVDLTKTQAIHSTDIVDLLRYYSNNHLKLPEMFVKKYETQISEIMLDMVEDVETYGSIIENIYIHYPHLSLYLDALDFVKLLNRQTVAPEFIQRLLKELSDEQSTNAMKKLLTICLEEVKNPKFHKALVEIKKLDYQARICIYDENLSPRDNHHSPRFKFRAKIEEGVSNSLDESVKAC